MFSKAFGILFVHPTAIKVGHSAVLKTTALEHFGPHVHHLTTTLTHRCIHSTHLATHLTTHLTTHLALTCKTTLPHTLLSVSTSESAHLSTSFAFFRLNLIHLSQLFRCQDLCHCLSAIGTQGFPLSDLLILGHRILSSKLLMQRFQLRFLIIIEIQFLCHTHA